MKINKFEKPFTFRNYAEHTGVFYGVINLKNQKTFFREIQRKTEKIKAIKSFSNFRLFFALIFNGKYKKTVDI